MKKLLFLLFLLAPAFVFGQTGTIRGNITSVLSNEPLTGVSVAIVGTATGTTTDSLGNYTLAGLRPGYYTLQISLVGYRPKTLFDIQVTNAKIAVADVGLEDDSQTLNEVKVAAPRFFKTLESPVSLRTIGSTEIKRNPGGNRDISKVIQSLPGVSSPVSFRNDIIIRGGAPNENRFYIDGIEIPNINHFATQGSSGGPVGLINVDFINEVDFYSGAFPANRGNSLSSVFEFKQKDGPTDRTNATLTLGSSDFAATLAGPFSKKTTFISSYRYSYLQGLFKLIGLPFLPSYQDFQFKVKTKFNTKNELTILGLGALDRFKLNLDAKNTELNQYTLANIPVNSQNNYTIGATYKNFRANGYSLFVLSRDYLDNRAKKFQDNNEAGTKTLDYNSKEIENKFRFENVSRANDYRISFGAGAETAQYTTNTFNLLPFNSNIYTSEINFFKYSLFGQLSKAYFKDKLNLSFGARADANTYSSKMNNLAKTLSPRFSASYNISEKLSINFNTGIYYQLPAYTVLGYRDSTGALANRDVKYISNKQVVLGLEYNTLKNTRFTIEGFYKHYKDYPVERVLGDSIPLANLGADFGVVGNQQVVGYTKGRSYGVEFFAQQRLNKGFYGIFALTLFRSEFQDKNGRYVQSSWNNRYILSMTGGKVFSRNWEVGAKLRYTGGSPYTPYNISSSTLKSNYAIFPQGIPDWQQLNSRQLNNFYQLDVRVDKKYPFKRFTLNVYLDIQNLTYNQYQLQPYLVPDRDAAGNLQDAPGDPSRFRSKLLDNKGGNVLPTIGVIFEL
ncbi:TonB-dependent receptor [Mucilaginibacter psychrotolerans]|uniref:TonB-dependent receptor n=1 Tax=Mucilaginibacter psychrotolerans TaxID=1524096 RepID=A0A4Y8SDI2_9SPHI|nr:TonB-dependent receptor [Mucilaginibacter psychrotolerans]TFF37089.1 TonB-dependent receptor [Mucilaginibacter psychrotolerans]